MRARPSKRLDAETTEAARRVTATAIRGAISHRLTKAEVDVKRADRATKQGDAHRAAAHRYEARRNLREVDAVLDVVASLGVPLDDIGGNIPDRTRGLRTILAPRPRGPKPKRRVERRKTERRTNGDRRTGTKH